MPPNPDISTNPDISICIVNYNGRDLLRNLLCSIEATRDGLAVQTIVVDNASADASADMVAADFPQVHLLRNARNLGFARANNQAAERAAAPYLLFLNNDTVLRPGALQHLHRFLSDHPECCAAAPRLVGSDGRPQQTVRNFPTLAALLNQILFLKWTRLFRRAYRVYRTGGFDPEAPAAVPQVAAAAILIRRGAFDRAGGWDDGFEFGVEDVDLCKRLAPFGVIQYLPVAQIDHLGRIASRANRPFVYRGYECGWARYLRKHHGRRFSSLYKLLVTLDMPLRVTLLAGATLIHAFRPDRAFHYKQRLSAAASFLFTSLPAFWRA